MNAAYAVTESEHPCVVGYMVPEFPGPTHTFFWREITVLEQLGAEVVCVSTRRPAHCPHPWAAEARARTLYVFPPWRHVGAILAEATRVRPAGWLRVLRCVMRSEGRGFLRYVRAAALAVTSLILVRHARRRGITHLHSHFSFDGATVVMFASIFSGIPYSLSYHGHIERSADQSLKWGRAAFGISITRHGIERLRAQVGDQMPRRMLVAPMGVDANRFARTAPYRPCAAGETFRIFSCGRLTRNKGYEDLLRAVALLRERSLPIRLRIGGSTLPGRERYRVLLESLRGELGLEAEVEFLGALDEEAVRRELEACHAFALASFEEPFGVVYAEAMAMGVPTVGTAAGGVPELIEDGGSGLLVPARDPESLADALERLSGDPALAARLGRSGSERVRRDFSHERSARALLEGIANLARHPA